MKNTRSGILWHRRLLKLPLTEKPIINQGITPDQIDYLRSRHYFLQLFNPQESYRSKYPHERIELFNGWEVIDYGNILMSSSGEKALDQNLQTSEDSDASLPSNTLMGQAIDAALQMVVMAYGRGWPEILVVDGSPLMSWAAWFYADYFGIEFGGYTPSKADLERAELLTQWVKHPSKALGKAGSS